jgi:hypothetical protein
VWVAIDELSLRLQAHGMAGGLAPRNEKLLLGCEAIDYWNGVSLHRRLERQVSDAHAGEIGNGFVAHALAIVVNAWLDEVTLELVDQALAALVEILPVFLAPPILRVQLQVDCRACGIDGMGEIMRDGNPHGAVIHGIRRLRTEERRLQRSRG